MTDEQREFKKRINREYMRKARKDHPEWKHGFSQIPPDRCPSCRFLLDSEFHKNFPCFFTDQNGIVRKRPLYYRVRQIIFHAELDIGTQGTLLCV